MTLPDTPTQIYCQTCSTAWDKADANTGYYFRSPSFPIGSYTSPSVISTAGEEMTFCPACDVPPLSEPYKQPGPGIQESPFYRGQSRMEGEREEDVTTRDAELSSAEGDEPDTTHQP